MANPSKIVENQELIQKLTQEHPKLMQALYVEPKCFMSNGKLNYTRVAKTIGCSSTTVKNWLAEIQVKYQ